MRIVIVPEEKNRLKSLLKKYYDVELKFKSGIELIESKDGSLDKLMETYAVLPGPCENDDTIIKVISLMAYYFENNKPLADEESFHNVLQKNIRQDLLRLYVFCNNSLKNYENINISSRVDSIKLGNNCNWLWNDLVKDYLKANLPDITSVAQAKDELIRGKSKRGRQPKDARIPVVIWGTYRLLTDLHGFQTPMPNSLCDFLVKLLQNMEILPENTEIDKYWIRAELRYIKDKEAH